MYLLDKEKKISFTKEGKNYYYNVMFFDFKKSLM